MLIDSHCHLNFKDSYPNLGETYAIMQEHDVDQCIVVGVDLPSSQIALEQGQQHTWIHPTVGVHPCSREFSDSDEEWHRLESLAADPACVAVGETGVDLFHDDVPIEVQQKRFHRHFEIAQQVEKPLIVHCRDADQECFNVLKNYGRRVPGVLHCWAGGLELAQYAMEQGWYVSLAGNVTFKNAISLQKAAAQIPPERLLVETDSPFLTPHPHRGQPNHPGMTSHVARFLAKLHNLSYQEFSAITRQNTLQLFQLEID